jgi:hypothetical protein
MSAKKSFLGRSQSHVKRMSGAETTVPLSVSSQNIMQALEGWETGVAHVPLEELLPLN